MVNNGRISALLIITILLLSVGSYAKEVKVTIYHMNDIHADIRNFAKVAHIVNEDKKKNKNVYFFNLGDNFSGNPIVDQYEPKGEPLLILFKLMNFDALALGNHEFDYGRKILKRFIKKSSFETLCANVVDKDGWLANTKPYIELTTKEGIKIALLGVIQVEKDINIPSTHPKNLDGIKFKDELTTIKEYSYLKKNNDIFVLLSHMGLEMDIRSAENFVWIDLIIGGHSHTIIEDPKEYNGVLITQAGDHGKYLGKIDLVFENRKLISKKGSLIDLAKVQKQNRSIRKKINEFYNNETLNRVVANLPFVLRGKRELGNMICDAMIAHQSVDFSFMNRGGIRVGKLGKKVTVSDIYTMHPFNNDIVVFQLSPDEIRNLIVTSFKKGGKIDLYAGGLFYTIFKNRNNGIEKIILKDRNGKLLDGSKKYSVAINNYIASAYKFKKKDPGRSANITLAQVVTEYLKNCKAFPKYKKIHRTKIELFIDKNSRSVGSTEVTISNKGVWKGSCASGNLITDSLVSEMKTNISFYPSRNLKGGIKINENSKIYADIIPLLYNYSQKNKVIYGNMKGKDIVDFLFKIVKLRNRTDLQVSGINYILTKNSSGRVIGIDCYEENFIYNKKKKKIEGSKIYKVAFTDYEFEKLFGIKDKVTNIKKSKRTIKQILEDYIMKKKVITEIVSETRIKIKKGN